MRPGTTLRFPQEDPGEPEREHWLVLRERFKGMTATERFWARVDKGSDDKCWPWLGAVHKVNGYGNTPNKKLPGSYAHRIAYVLTNGPVAPGLQIDHLCRNRICVNPAHLEAVTQAENIRRGAAAITHCRHGHAYTPENTYRNKNGSRGCKACHRRASSERYHRLFSTAAKARLRDAA